MIVTGVISYSNVFVATKDTPQKVTARRINEKLTSFVLNKRDRRNFINEIPS
jgi:hypothetical protein